MPTPTLAEKIAESLDESGALDNRVILAREVTAERIRRILDAEEAAGHGVELHGQFVAFDSEERAKQFIEKFGGRLVKLIRSE